MLVNEITVFMLIGLESRCLAEKIRKAMIAIKTKHLRVTIDAQLYFIYASHLH